MDLNNTFNADFAKFNAIGEVRAVASPEEAPNEDTLSELFADNMLINELSPETDLKPKSIEQLFQDDALLVRAFSAGNVFEDLSYTFLPKLGSLKEELDYMKSEEGLKNTSSTLIVPNYRVGLYEPLGILFNAETSEIDHICGIDSNSCTDDDGNLSAAANKELIFKSLKELSRAIKHTDLLQRGRMNEVNGKFFLKDMTGLVSRTLANSIHNAVLNLKIRAIQKLISKKHKIDLPIYKYNEDLGHLKKLATDTNTIQMEIISGKCDPVLRYNINDIKQFLLT